MTEAISFRTNPEPALALFNEQGFFIEQDVLSPEQCDRVIAATRRLPNALNGDFRPQMNVHKMDAVFYEVMSLPAIVRVMDLLVGGEAFGLQSQLFMNPPDRMGMGVHQDNYFVEAPDGAFASAWTALVDVDRSNGGLYGYPGIHKSGRRPVREVLDQANAGITYERTDTLSEETDLPDGLDRVDVRIPKGAVLFLHGDFPHGSYRNMSDGHRYALLNTYIRAGEPFRRGNTGRREQVPVRGIAPADFVTRFEGQDV